MIDVGPCSPNNGATMIDMGPGVRANIGSCKDLGLATDCTEGPLESDSTRKNVAEISNERSAPI